jgi:hypothetical protein
VRAAASSLAALAAILLAACGSGAGSTCPGAPVAVLRFVGQHVVLGDPSLTPDLDPDTTVPDCEAALAYPDVLPGFVATLSADARTRVAALCRPEDVVLLGQRSGDRLTVETRTDGAVLGGCAPNCSAEIRVVVTGDLLSTDGATTFRGSLVEITAQAGGSCGTCALPCAARYSLTGTP